MIYTSAIVVVSVHYILIATLLTNRIFNHHIDIIDYLYVRNIYIYIYIYMLKTIIDFVWYLLQKKYNSLFESNQFQSFCSGTIVHCLFMSYWYGIIVNCNRTLHESFVSFIAIALSCHITQTQIWIEIFRLYLIIEFSFVLVFFIA